MTYKYPELIAERIRKQASAARISPSRLLIEEAADMQRAYMLALELLSSGTPNEDSANR